MKYARLIVLACLIVACWALPAFAAGTITVKAPAEGATVQAPVVLDYFADVAASHLTVRLEAAKGRNATAGFVDARMEYKLKPGTRVVDQIVWNAEGFNPGPYTLRFTAVDLDTNQELARAHRNVILQGPDYSPQVTLNAPATLGGTAMIAAAIVDADLTSWRLVLVDAAGQIRQVSEGQSASAFPVRLEVADLPDGAYTLRLTAIDRVGQEGMAEQKVQVKNLGPTIQGGMAAVDPVTTTVPITYKASSSVKVTVTVADAQGHRLTSGETTSDRREGTLNVPVSFRGLRAGQYAATATVQDQQGRTGSHIFTVLVREALPAARLEVPATADGDYFVSVVLPDGLKFVRMEEHRRTGQGLQVSNFPVLPSGNRLSLQGRASGEGFTAYRIVLYTADGRMSESDEALVVTDYTAPSLGRVSVAPVDGLGINLRWEAATDTVGIRGYEVILVTGTEERVLAKMGPDHLAYAEGLPEGDYQVYLAAIDLGGHRTNSDLLTFRVQAGAIPLLRNGVFLPTDVPGFAEEGRTWVPLRVFSQALGYTVTWDGARQAATIQDPTSGRSLVATVGDAKLRVTGPEGNYDTEIAPPRLIENRVVVPLRALAEALGVKVQWHQATQTVELLMQ